MKVSNSEFLIFKCSVTDRPRRQVVAKKLPAGLPLSGVTIFFSFSFNQAMSVVFSRPIHLGI